MTQLAARCSCITVTWFQNKRRFPNNRPIKKNAGKKTMEKGNLKSTGFHGVIIILALKLATTWRCWNRPAALTSAWKRLTSNRAPRRPPVSARPQQTFHYPVYGPGSLEYHKLLSKKCLWKSVGYFGIWNMICLSPIHPNLVAHHLAMGP